MEDWLGRTKLLLGCENVERLAQARVAVFGLGGVGGYVVEALARSGVGALDLVDHDVIMPSNRNRQILATVKTVGRPKAEVAAERVLEINPDCRVRVHRVFFLPETAAEFDFAEYDYVVDAIDTVTGKLLLAERAAEAGVPVISSMGAGNKLDPAAFRVADIYETKVCPLAKVMRRELRKRGIEALKVVYSEEPPITPEEAPCGGWELQDGAAKSVSGSAGKAGPEDAGQHAAGTVPTDGGKRRTPGSVAFVPAAAGLIIAGEVVRDLCTAGEAGRE
ncbi:MAG: tRNA threonylcarbamoyladenosine dehydratase [bacterium]|nr:tRNA threonylcarbamoyladenosine dehydratase [bacterium]